ncbi:GD16008 [Drosophila simulans]|uniref:GD16008 n=1 Tax=Drosophila simulans TaxID=7240 RepID=B4R2Q0_DROSI|nr:GD16008 [Drosophila simulans]
MWLDEAQGAGAGVYHYEGELEVGALELGNSCDLGALRNVRQGGSWPKRYCNTSNGNLTEVPPPKMGL